MRTSIDAAVRAVLGWRPGRRQLAQAVVGLLALGGLFAGIVAAFGPHGSVPPGPTLPDAAPIASATATDQGPAPTLPPVSFETTTTEATTTTTTTTTTTVPPTTSTTVAPTTTTSSTTSSTTVPPTTSAPTTKPTTPPAPKAPTTTVTVPPPTSAPPAP